MIKRDKNGIPYRENMVNWLKSFADDQALKLAEKNNIDPQEFKNAGYNENILEIVERNKKTQVQAKVDKYRMLVGLDDVLNNKIEKAGENETAKTTTASRRPLSIRDKVASNEEAVAQFIDQVVRNRNGNIATPAIIEQLQTYLKISNEWLQENYDKIEAMVEDARKNNVLVDDKALPVNELATDQTRLEKEPALFTPPTKPAE